MAVHFTLISLLAFNAPIVAAAPGNMKNPQAVKEVLAGTRPVANAAWWGFDEEDVTDALQAAIKSRAKKLIIPNVGKEWIVRPLTLVGNQELVLEKGVVITAKRGSYRGGGDSVFNANDLEHLTIRGYGATVRMQKEDYMMGRMQDIVGERWFGIYERAEWRMALALRGCIDVKVYGLILRDSGGDGIMICGGGKIGTSKDIQIKDVLCDNNHRQGISITNVVGLTVENCAFNNTWGTPPCSGVDIEPDMPRERIQHIVFRDCRFENNYGDGIELFLAHQTKESADVSIRFERCHVSSRRGTGIRVTKVLDNGPQGLIEFRDCVVDGTVGYGIKVQDKAPDKARVRFVNCSVKDAAQNRQYMGAWAPIWLHLFRPEYVKKLGGIDFVKCTVHDTRARPAIVADCPSGLFDVTGTITVDNPHGVKTQLPSKQEGVTLEVKAR